MPVPTPSSLSLQAAQGYPIERENPFAQRNLQFFRRQISIEFPPRRAVPDSGDTTPELAAAYGF
jgi:hypothetical protein